MHHSGNWRRLSFPFTLICPKFNISSYPFYPFITFSKFPGLRERQEARDKEWAHPLITDVWLWWLHHLAIIPQDARLSPARCSPLVGILLHFLPFYFLHALIKFSQSDSKRLILVIKAFSHSSDNKLINISQNSLNRYPHLNCLFWTSIFAFVILLIGNSSLAIFTCYLFSTLDCFIMTLFI